MHPWIGAGDDDRRRILSEIGLTSVDQLFESIPAEVCVDRLPMPDGRDEETIRIGLAAMALQNLSPDCVPSFLGAGVYRHVQPSVVDAVLSRAEFFTSYTPYQPEISQGTLQAIFEFQTLMCELTGLEVANASLYDGATALVEAVLFAHRVKRGKLDRVVLAETVHPMYRKVLSTYAGPAGVEVVVVPPGDDGRVSVDALCEAAGTGETCCVAVQSPNFLGVIEDLPAISGAAHDAGALAVQVVAEAVSLGMLTGGGAHDFDVVCGEAQSFGLAPGFGGPHLGFFACREKQIRQMPGRLAGETIDSNGRRAFCLTLSTREQHIRRAKATSNICTNQGLMALAATVWLECIGGHGLRELAKACFARSEDLKRRIADLGEPWRLAHPDAPTFNEFLITGPGSGDELAARLAADNVLAGVPSHLWGGSWADGLVVAATERNTAADADALINAMGGLS
ncbi:MAG: aminomethyl-transferring glycine dehydrogenase subunit GcvPA [Thermoanaerobaculales bacterium]|jgi:glycine dehydrogenase subunit 1|nr:aminomethyl-transferring glycine dehydrogenase subunit GcvPA [Thermoanaerobaculales bacterium]